MKLLLTSYKLHDAIHEAVGPALSAWLDANAKKWRVQVRWDLPDTDTEQLAGLAAALQNMLNTVLPPRRALAVQRLIAQIEGTAEPVAKTKPKKVVKPRPEPEPEPEPEPVEAALRPRPNLGTKADPISLPDLVTGFAKVGVPAIQGGPVAPVAQAPEAPQAPQEPTQATEPALAAQITCSDVAATAAPARLLPEARPAIPPPELRATTLLGALFGRIQRGEE